MVEGWQHRGVEIVNIFAPTRAPQCSRPRPGSRSHPAGPVLPRPDRTGITTRLVDLETGEDITSKDRLGELRFRGPTVFNGYLESDGAEFDDLGYYRTGDRSSGWTNHPRCSALSTGPKTSSSVAA